MGHNPYKSVFAHFFCWKINGGALLAGRFMWLCIIIFCVTQLYWLLLVLCPPIFLVLLRMCPNTRFSLMERCFLSLSSSRWEIASEIISNWSSNGFFLCFASHSKRSSSPPSMQRVKVHFYSWQNDIKRRKGSVILWKSISSNWNHTFLSLWQDFLPLCCSQEYS